MPTLLIKHKIWIGFAILLTILLINAMISVFNLQHARDTVRDVIEKSQPLVLAAHKFNGYLAKASSSLSSYLLTKSDKQRQNYQNAQYEAGEVLKEMAAMTRVKQSKELQASLQKLQSLFEKFQAYEKRMLALASSPTLNEPATDFAAQNINPESISVLGSLTSMIAAEDEEELSEERMAWMQYLHEYRYNFAKLMTSLRLFLASPQPGVLENLLNSLEQIEVFNKKMADFEDLYNFEQEEGVAILNRNIENIRKNLQTMVDLNQSPKRRMDSYLMDEEINPLLVKMQDEIDDLVYAETVAMEQGSEDLLSTVDTGLKVKIILAVLGLALGILVAFVISRMITRPLNETVTALQQAAAGDGDLSRRIDVKSRDELGDLAQAFNQFSEKLQQLMIEVSGCSNQLIQSADEMNRVVANTESDIQVQNEQIDQIAESIGSMVKKIQHVTEHTGKAAGVAEQTFQIAQEGKAIVSRSLQSSDEVANNVDQAAKVINELESDVSSISGVLDVIRGIAEQTNLLALNAAIEAARAGEQGRGFAVVADEVRTLASRTQDSTAEIQDMIQRLQSGSQRAVAVMTTGKEKAGEGLEQARMAGQSLEKIGTAAESMLGMNREIASSTEEQNQTANQVCENVNTINELSEQTVSSSVVLSENGRTVNSLALQLQKLMKQFKV